VTLLIFVGLAAIVGIVRAETGVDLLEPVRYAIDWVNGILDRLTVR
jgi:hypothetical protein